MFLQGMHVKFHNNSLQTNGYMGTELASFDKEMCASVQAFKNWQVWDPIFP